MKLMQSNVHTLPVQGSQKIYWDSSTPGFGVRVTSGGSRSYVAQGQVKGRTCRFTIAPVNLLALAQARTRAERVLLDMRDGTNPVEAKRLKVVEGATLRNVMQDYLDHKTTRYGALRPSSKKSIQRHIEVNFSSWADRPIAALQESDILKQFRVLKKQGVAQSYQATSILQSLMKWARKTNKAVLEEPLSILKGERQKPNARDRRVPNELVGEVFAMLRERAKDDHIASTRIGADIVSFMLLTGARWGEASKLTWDRVRLDDKVPSWRLREQDAKNHRAMTLPLSTAAHALLSQRFAERVASSPCVFPGRQGRLLGDARPTMKYVSKIAGLHLSVHDLRRTFSNVAIKANVDLFKAELLTCHVPTGTTLVHYVETSDLRESCAAEIERVGKWIVEQAAIASGANVVPLLVKANTKR
jgi:integrase